MCNSFHEFFWNVKKNWNVFTKIFLAKGTTECKKAIFKLQSKRVHFLPATKKQFVSKNSSNPPIFQGKSKTFCKTKCYGFLLFFICFWKSEILRLYGRTLGKNCGMSARVQRKTEFYFCFGNWLQIFRAEIQKFLIFFKTWLHFNTKFSCEFKSKIP